MTDYEKEKWRIVINSANDEELNVIIEELARRGYVISKDE